MTDERRRVLQYLIDQIDAAAAECAALANFDDGIFADLYSNENGAADAVAKLHSKSDGRPVCYKPVLD